MGRASTVASRINVWKATERNRTPARRGITIEIWIRACRSPTLATEGKARTLTANPTRSRLSAETWPAPKVGRCSRRRWLRGLEADLARASSGERVRATSIRRESPGRR